MFKSIVNFFNAEDVNTFGRDATSTGRWIFLLYTVLVLIVLYSFVASGGRIASADRNATPVKQTTNYHFCPNCGEEVK